MSRALTGSERMIRPGVWEMTVPVRRKAAGETRVPRISRRFPTPKEARAWRDAAVEAVQAGLPVPEPSDLWSTVETVAADQPPIVMSLAEVAEKWVLHRSRHRRGGHSRAGNVRSNLDKWILPFFADITDVRTLHLDHGSRFVEHLAGYNRTLDGSPLVDASGHLVLSMHPDVEMTIAEAAEETGLSAGRIERALRRTQPGVQDLFVTPAALEHAGLVVLADPHGLVEKTAIEVMWVLNRVISFAVTLRAMTRDELPWEAPRKGFVGDVPPIEPADSRRLRPVADAPEPVSMGDSRTLASHLTWVHQLTFWVLRLLGLRMGEAFGLLVGDIHRADWGAFVMVERQGGKKFWFRDSEQRWTFDTMKSQLKTDGSVRAIAIPSKLLVLIDLVIDACHTDAETGAVDLQARLIPGPRTTNEGGPEAFRTALVNAARSAGLGHLVPKLMRATLGTDLENLAVKDDIDFDYKTARRILGHVRGHDVHDRHYVLDDPALVAVRKAMDAVDQTITDDILLPTNGRHRFRRQHPLASRLDYIEAVLSEGGWVVGGGDIDSDPLLGTGDVARLLNLSDTYTRRLMEAGTIACEMHPVGPTKTQRFARHSAVMSYVESLGDRRVLPALAEEYGLSYHQARDTLLRLFPNVPVCPRTRGEVLVIARPENLVI